MTTAVYEETVANPRPGIAGWLDRVARVPLSLHQLLFRLGVASVFFKAGMVKASSWESTVALFRDEYRVPVLPPELAATFATAFELTCSTLLILGLGTRLATLPLLGMIATIQLFVYPSAWSEHLVWASILLFLLTRGPGVISVDHLVARAWVRRRGGGT
jgi:putative oxidoreductase